MQLDIWRVIFWFLDIRSKVLLTLSCQYFRQHLYVTDLHGIESGYLTKVSDEVMVFPVFLKAESLAICCRNIRKIHLKHLKKLSVFNYNINQGLINLLDLVELSVDNCHYIINVSFMRNLKKLSARESCGIGQDAITHLDLIELDVRGNYKITDVSFMKSLKVLDASRSCGIGQIGIRGLDLIKLNVNFNRKITDVSFMRNLKILHISYSDIRQTGIRGLDLVCLYAENSPVTDVSFMKNLKKLDVSGKCGIDQEGIKGLLLMELSINDNCKINDLSTMKNLKELYARNNGICQDGISQLDLLVLDRRGNSRIFDVSFMKNLVIYRQ